MCQQGDGEREGGTEERNLIVGDPTFMACISMKSLIMKPYALNGMCNGEIHFMKKPTLTSRSPAINT